jgi:hypothetical protein
MVASPYFFLRSARSSARLDQADLNGYEILFNFIQRGPYCPCFPNVVYLVATEDEFLKLPVQEMLP